MSDKQLGRTFLGFSLVEVVIAMGLVSFSVLATVGLLSVANDTNKKARDEGLATRLASNEFERLRSLGATSAFWTSSPLAYTTRYFDSNLTDLGTDKPTALTKGTVYEFRIQITSTPAGPADELLNAEVRYPPQAATANQSVFRFTTLMNIPTP